MSRGSSPINSGSRERKIELSPGAKKHSPRPRIPSSVSIRTKVQSKLPSTTAVFNLTIFKLPVAPDGRLYADSFTVLKGCTGKASSRRQPARMLHGLDRFEVDGKLQVGLRQPRRSYAAARPRRGAHSYRPNLSRLGGRRRIQRGARAAALLWHAHRCHYCIREKSYRTTSGRPDSARRSRHVTYSLGALRRYWSSRTQWAQLYRTRFRRARSGWLLRPGKYGNRQ